MVIFAHFLCFCCYFLSFFVDFLYCIVIAIPVQLMNVPVQMVTMMQGLILLCVLGGEIFIRNKVVAKKTKAGKKEVQA